MASQETGEEFSTKMYKQMMSGFVAAGVAYGDTLGLWETLAKFDEPKTVGEISAAANLKER